MAKPGFARFVVLDRGLDVRGERSAIVLGKQWRELLQVDTVYEVVDCLGELTLRPLGPSCLAEPKATGPKLSYANPPDLIEDGTYLYTDKEYAMKCKAGK